MRNGAMWCAARKGCDGGQAGADRGELGAGKDWQSTIGEPTDMPLVSPFLNGSAAAQLNSILSTDRACILRDVGEDPSPDTPRAAPSVRCASF